MCTRIEFYMRFSNIEANIYSYIKKKKKKIKITLLFQIFMLYRIFFFIPIYLMNIE